MSDSVECVVCEEIVEEKKEPKEQSSPKEQSPKEPPKKSSSKLPDIFTQSLKSLTTSKEKLHLCVEHMSKALLEKPYNFKVFWDIRNFVLGLLKNEEDAAVKADFWNDITHLTQEARRLKDQAIKESSFAQEQIETAIGALEKDLDSSSSSIDMEALQFPQDLLKHHQEFYNASQGELSLLNAYATKINSLRKELTKTQLRLKSKNQLFERLSKAGDMIFPKRKGLIQNVSESFVEDVSHFCGELEDVSKAQKRLSMIRDEIKELQRIAKLLTLNTFAFNKTRQLLSNLWDQVKTVERERKKEMGQIRAESQKDLDLLIEELDQLKKEYDEEVLTYRQVEHKITELIKKAKYSNLDRFHFRKFKEVMQPLNDAVNKKIQEVIDRKQEEEQKIEQERKDLITAYFQEIQSLTDSLESTELPECEASILKFKESLLKLPLHKREKTESQKLLKKLQEKIDEKREETLLNLSDDDKATIGNLNQVLSSREQRRKEIRHNLKELRKSQASSGFDFVQALEFDQQIKEEEDSLSAMDQKILEIEFQIKKIKSL